MASFGSWYVKSCKLWPYSMAFATCVIRGSLADGMVQSNVQKSFNHIHKKSESINVDTMLDEPNVYHDKSIYCCSKPTTPAVSSEHCFDWKRNAKFALFNGLHGGWWQHLLYNTIFPMLIPSAAIGASIAKTMIDCFIHIPFIYFPSYYAFKSVTDGDSPLNGIKEYWNEDKWTLLKPCWQLWVPVSFGILHFIPPHLKIAAVSVVSLLWMMILSYKSPMASKKVEFSFQSESESQVSNFKAHFQ